MLTDKFETSTLASVVAFSDTHDVIVCTSFPTNFLFFVSAIRLKNNDMIRMVATDASAIL